MYLFVVIALMLVLPLASIVLQHIFIDPAAPPLLPVGKWFVFWSIGMRLTLAGLRQIFQPRYTAETILDIRGSDSWLLVRELGFANVAIGTLGICSLFFPAWVLPCAILGAIFYGLAGINHLTHAPRTRLQNIAMGSDLFVGAVLLIYCVFWFGTPG